MNFHSTVALLALASVAGAQSKLNIEKPPAVPGHYPPPPGMHVVLAGGSDDCANAAVSDSIGGLGVFAVTTTGATTGLAPQPVGFASIKNDVWFLWTSTVTGTVIMDTCAQVTADTKIAVWADNNGGACPSGTELAYNDDTCALQSRVTFAATTGSTYFLQVGAYTEGVTYTGTFSLSTPPPPPTNDTCATPIAISGAGPHPFDTTAATTGTEGQAEALCLYASTTAIQKDTWFTWTPSVTGSATLTTCGLVTGGSGSYDTKVAIYAGTGCPSASAVACNDDSCSAQLFATTVTFNTVCGQPYTIQLGNYLNTASISGTFTITETGSTCSTPSVPYCFGDGTGAACPCGNTGAAGNGCANSLNANGANIASSGASSISADTLVLQGSGMPNSSALYFQGTTQVTIPFGDGLRCAGGSVIRLGTKSNTSGSSSYPTGADPRVSVRGLCSVGDVRNYQCWYRNAAAFCTASTFNLTNGLQVTWNP